MRYRDLIKAVLINILILAMGQMTVCNVKGVTHSNKATENVVPLSYGCVNLLARHVSHNCFVAPTRPKAKSNIAQFIVF